MDAVEVEAPVIAVTFTLSPGDFVRGFLFHTRRTIRLFSGVTGALGVLMAIGLLVRQPGSGPAPIGAMLEFFAIAIGYPLLIVLTAIVQFRGRRDATNNRMTWSCFQDRIDCVTATSRSSMQWAAFVKVCETKSAFLFYPQKAMFILVPKQVLDPEGVATLRRLVVEKLGRNAKVLRERVTSPGQRAWTRTLSGVGYGFVLLLFAVVIQTRHGTFIPAAVSSAPFGLLDMPVAVLATPFIWAVLAGLAGSSRWRTFGLALVSLHTVTAVWFLTGSSIADWGLFHNAMDAMLFGLTAWAGLYLVGVVWLWSAVLRRR